MNPLFLTATTLVSAMGRGTVATLEALHASRSGLRPCNFAGVDFGHVGQVAGLEDHFLPPALARFDCRNRLADLALRTDGFAAAVAAARARYGAARIAVVLGTSTSGILSSEEAYRARDPATGALPAAFDYEHTHDMAALARFVRAALDLRGPSFVVSTACASSAKAFADAALLIGAGLADAAVVGGADSLCRMTLRGFAALELISPVPCRPCAADRAGLSIGEAAGFVLLEPALPESMRREPAGVGVALLGVGASSDGHHMSAPHPQGAGAAAAMRAALDAAGLAPGNIDYVNLHGTGTPANDAMEDTAVVSVFGTDTPCSSTKGWSGHTLGAAGVAEAVIASLCIRAGLLPGCLGLEAPDPALRARILTANQAGPVRRVLSNSFGFGGINCSLVLGAV